MAVRGQDIASIIKQQIEQFGAGVVVADVGTVVEVGDGIARIHGLRGCKYNELIQFQSGVAGLALNLEEDTVGAVIMGEDSKIKEGEQVRTTGRIIEVPVGEALIGRVVNPLGEPL
ncbi:MAG: F0F1 ATP synthase subunit alpha, partial [Chloroflexi bacterium]|nr:F0F1 ATP synthase subunit alpha [Chloroflexota bacterium]